MSDERLDAAESRLVGAARAALDASIAGLDDDIRVRLAAARRRAVAIADGSAPDVRPAPARWQPALGFVATIAATCALWLAVVVPPMPVYPDPVETVAAQDLELLEELEFAAWMLREAEAGDALAG